MDLPHRLFIYGTLKRGQPNHYILTAEDTGVAKYFSLGKTIDKYPLVIGSKANLPYFLDLKGKGHNIEGEIWDVDDKCLAFLDDFEGYPGYYNRKVVGVKGQDGSVFKCWVYYLNKLNKSLLEEPYLRSYDTNGDHGKIYSPEADESDPEDL